MPLPAQRRPVATTRTVDVVGAPHDVDTVVRFLRRHGWTALSVTRLAGAAWRVLLRRSG